VCANRLTQHKLIKSERPEVTSLDGDDFRPLAEQTARVARLKHQAFVNYRDLCQTG